MPALASPWAVQAPQGSITAMKAGDTAPFNGTLFDTQAVAEMIAEKESSQERHALDKQHALDTQAAKLELDMANLRAGKEAAEQRLDEIVEIKNDQIEFLSTQLEESTKRPKRNWGPAWFAGGIVSGILLMAVSAYAYREIVR